MLAELQRYRMHVRAAAQNLPVLLGLATSATKALIPNPPLPLMFAALRRISRLFEILAIAPASPASARKHEPRERPAPTGCSTSESRTLPFYGPR